MSISNITELKSHPNWQTALGVEQRDDPIFQRAVCTWTDNNQYVNKYYAVLDTTNGDLYLDCRRRKIWLKNAVFIVLRPLYTLSKTLYHASIIIPLAIETFRWIRGQQTAKDLVKHTFQSWVDIIRTPLYGLAITLTHVVALILGCISPNSLYRTRKFIGTLERKMHRVEDIFEAKYSLSPCFSPLDNLFKDSSNNWVKKTMTKIKTDLSWFASSQVTYRRDHRAIFNDCGFLASQNSPYISAAAPSA